MSNRGFPTSRNPREGERLWAITSYFNPLWSKNRLINYRSFRANLEPPLLTVEWSVDGRFELVESDADVLIQLSSPDLLWQKERMLDLGLRALPDGVDFVAWLDCDIIFERPGWPALAQRELESSSVVQLFSRCVYRGPDGNSDEDAALSIVQLARQRDDHAMFERLWGRPKAGGPRRDRLTGLAWAGRLELLERHGFYDACVFGAGDRAFACATFGQHRLAAQAWLRTPQQRRHYFAWADAFADELGGQVGLVEGDIIHLWHGTLENRQHRVRHAAAERHHFDPDTDIAIDPETGLWRWASPKPELHEAVADFFDARQEDVK